MKHLSNVLHTLFGLLVILVVVYFFKQSYNDVNPVVAEYDVVSDGILDTSSVKQDSLEVVVDDDLLTNPLDTIVQVKGYPIEMVYVENGAFDMGSDGSYPRSESEKPSHKVIISKNYYIGRYEVTQKLWITIMGYNPSIFKGDYLPVENVSWYDVNPLAELVSLNEELTTTTSNN